MICFLGIPHMNLSYLNIKAIRPVEMLPYNYTKENYSRLGYVTEVTTYMGDLMLLRSGVSWKQFVKTQNQNLNDI